MFLDVASFAVFALAAPSSPSQRPISRQAVLSVQRPMKSDRCRPGSTRTATFARRHFDSMAVAWGGATIASSEAARAGQSLIGLAE
jgi:hypothetical protein